MQDLRKGFRFGVGINRNCPATIYTLFLITLLMLFNIGCSSVNCYQRDIYDDDARISKQGDSYSFRNRVGTTGENSIAFTFEGFYGKQTVWEMNAREDGSIVLDLKTEVENGRFKICLIHDVKVVSVISEGTVNNSVTLSLLKGKNYITVVGDNAKGKIDLDLSGNDIAFVKEIKD